MSVTAWLAVAVFAAAYLLIATEWIHRVAAALVGGLIMLVIGATDTEHAFFAKHAGIDWDVIFLLLGMMLIVSVLKRTGIFEFIAIWAAKRARGRPYRLMVLLIVATGFLSAWLDNVTTILLIAPVTILVCRRLGVPVIPYLIAEVMACNIGGAATLIGDPPNIMIGSRAGLSFNDFLLHMAPIVIVLMIVHGHRLLRECRGHRHRRAGGPPHLVPAVQPLRPDRHRRHRHDRRPVRVAALFRPCLTAHDWPVQGGGADGRAAQA